MVNRLLIHALRTDRLQAPADATGGQMDAGPNEPAHSGSSKKLQMHVLQGPAAGRYWRASDALPWTPSLTSPTWCS